jgi:hypothetical protein
MEARYALRKTPLLAECVYFRRASVHCSLQSPTVVLI